MCRKLRYQVGEVSSEVNERPLIDKITRAKAGAEDDIGLPASKTKLRGENSWNLMRIGPRTTMQVGGSSVLVNRWPQIKSQRQIRAVMTNRK